MADYIKSLMKEDRVFYPPKSFSKKAIIKNIKQYERLYQESVTNPEKFWAKQASQLIWFKKWDTVLRNDKNFFKWFEGGKINVSYNCLEKNTKSNKNKIALIWESEQGKSKTYSYDQLQKEVCKFANALKKMGVKKGKIVQIYLAMIPQLMISMLACARIGAIHSVVFSGFSSDSLKDRIKDSNAEFLITADGSFRNGKIYPIKDNADKAVDSCPSIKKVIVVKRTNNKVNRCTMVSDCGSVRILIHFSYTFPHFLAKGSQNRRNLARERHGRARIMISKLKTCNHQIFFQITEK